MRPSIVTASLREPRPGWVEGFNGPSGLIVGVGKGVLRTLYCKRGSVLDMVPVDVCINLLCCIAWQTALDGHGRPIKVFNCTSQNPITWGQMTTLAQSSIRKAAFEGALWSPNLSAWENPYVNRLHQQLLHYGPAYGVDLICMFLGRRPFLTRISSMMQKATKVVEPFTGSWTWINENQHSLQASLTEEDRKVFCFDMSELHWPTYIDIFCQGIRDFVLCDSPDSQAGCRIKLKWLSFLDFMVKALFLLLFSSLFFRLFF